MEYVRDIVIAMIENNYLPNYQDTDKTIEAVNTAIDKIYAQLQKSHRERH